MDGILSHLPGCHSPNTKRAGLNRSAIRQMDRSRSLTSRSSDLVKNGHGYPQKATSWVLVIEPLLPPGTSFEKGVEYCRVSLVSGAIGYCLRSM